MRPKGLGFTDEEYGAKNDVDSSDRSQWGGQDYERRNSDFKHRGRRYGSPLPPPGDTGKYSDRYTDPGKSWEADEFIDERQAKFLTDFDNDFSNTHRSGREPHASYTEANDQILGMKWDEWKRKARRYGLSEEEAENALSHWLALND